MKRNLTALSLLSLMLIASACGSNTDENASSTSATPSTTSGVAATKATSQADPFGKFDQPVSLKIAKNISTKDLKFPNGDNAENNEFSRFIQQKLNVNVSFAFQTETPDAYNQKIGVSIASRDLPDAFLVDEKQLKQLVAANLIEDLTDVYAKNIGPKLKANLDSFGNRALGRATFNGKLMGIPNTNIGQQFSVMWVRQDWLDKYGMQPPKTVDDLIKVAKTFIDNDADGKGKHDTIGIAGDPNIAGLGMTNGFDPIMGAYHAFKGQWLKDASGNTAYSSTLPEMKTALSKLHDMYAQGIIDKQFAIRKDPNEVIANNQVGIVFGPWWIPWSPLDGSLSNDPKAEWKPYILPLDEKGKFNSFDQDPTNTFLVVKKGYAHPEAVIRVLNVEYNGIRNWDPDAANLYKDHQDLVAHWEIWPFTLQLDSETAVADENAALKKAIAANDPSSLDVRYKSAYDAYVKNKANPKKDVASWGTATALVDAGGVVGADNVVLARNQFFGKTNTMDQKWANLQKLENETFLKIIMGDQPLDSFDSFVKQWNDLGGKDIINEINQQIKK